MKFRFQRPRLIRIHAAVAAVAVAVSLSTAAALAAVSLSGAGATFPYPIYSKWFDVYAKKTGVQINYQSIGSGGGIQQFKARTVDFGASDAPMSNADMKDLPAPAVHIVTVAGAVAVPYNLPGISHGLRLDADTLSRIFLGEITTWNDPALVKLNPKIELPSTSIAVVHRSDGSGTTYIFTTYLSKVNSEWSSKVGAGKAVNWPVGIGGKGNEGVAGSVRQIEGSIGYVELAYAIQNNMPYALMRNNAGAYVAPSVKGTTAAAGSFAKELSKDVRTPIVNASAKDAYPICGFTFLLVYKNQTNAAKGKALVDFLKWAVTDGQSYAAGLYYAPLPKAIVAVDENAIKAIKY